MSVTSMMQYLSGDSFGEAEELQQDVEFEWRGDGDEAPRSAEKRHRPVDNDSRDEKADDSIEDDGFTTVRSRKKKKITSTGEEESDNLVEVCITCKEELPKQIALAKLLRAENIDGILRIRHKGPFKVLVLLSRKEQAQKLLDCKKLADMGCRPQGNGAAENAVKTVKKCLKRALHEGDDVNTALNRFLLQYRNCEHATTGVSPAVALQDRRLRSRLDALRPDAAAVVRDAQERKVARSQGTERQFRVGDAVLARDYTARGDKWAEGKVVKVTGPVSYKVEVGNKTEWSRHVDQLVSAECKNRYSLSRTSAVPEDPVTNDEQVDEEAEGDMYEDACDGAEDEARRAPATSPPTWPPSSAPASASARALRAFNRAKRTVTHWLE